MLRFERSVVIEAPVEDVFAYVADPTHLPEFWEGVYEVKDIQRLPQGGFTLTGISKTLGFTIEQKAEAIEFIPNQRIKVKAHSPYVESTVTLWFEKLDSRKTLVRGLGEYEFPGGPLAKLGEPFLARYTDHAAEMTVEALKAHMETGIPAGAAR